MKKKLVISVSITIITFSSCDNSTPENQYNSNHIVVKPDTEYIYSESTDSDNNNETIFGYYVGPFNADVFKASKKPMYSNLINISIDSINNETIYGHSIVAGNLRPFSGNYNKEGNVYHVEAKEPGNNKYDGVFNFEIDPPQITGHWTSYDSTLAVTKRSFHLNKKNYQYNPELPLNGINARIYSIYQDEINEGELITEDAGKINASTTLLKKEDVENMYKRDLEIMRNAIYARHGYSFKNREMRDFFDQYVTWYIPVSIDVSKDLTEIEKKNIELIKRYEKHAETYYDVFGR